ncbi:MAG: hypothetical protein IJ192_15090 [Clostridia bacterium]|nr:hypothetical protein [Clostridia bacterium]
MKDMYETKISDARWIAYDIPGNIGWILYIVCLVLCFRKGLDIFSLIAAIPAVLMLIAIAELVSERIAGLDRTIPKIRLYRGFGALTLGGLAGILISAVGLFIYSDKILMIFMLAGAVLCGVFAILLLAGYKKQQK